MQTPIINFSHYRLYINAIIDTGTMQRVSPEKEQEILRLVSLAPGLFNACSLALAFLEEKEETGYTRSDVIQLLKQAISKAKD